MNLTDDELLAAMKPHIDTGDGGYLCDMEPEQVIAAGRAAIAALEAGRSGEAGISKDELQALAEAAFVQHGCSGWGLSSDALLRCCYQRGADGNGAINGTDDKPGDTVYVHPEHGSELTRHVAGKLWEESSTFRRGYMIGYKAAAPQQPPPVGDDLSRDDLAKLLIASCIDINAGFAEIRLEGMTDDGKEVGDWCVTVARVDAAQPTAEATLRRIVEEADRHPFNPIGHVIEHVAPEARALSAPPVGVTDAWTDEQCAEFLSVAFRHCHIRGAFKYDDIRMGQRRATAISQQQPAPSVSEPKPQVHVGMIGHVDHGKTTLTAALTALAKRTPTNE